MELVISLWLAIAPARAFLASIAISLITAYLIWLFRAKVKLIWGSTSANFHRFKLGSESTDQNVLSIWTEKFYVQNVGKKTAVSIEIVFSESLTSYNLWPPRDHQSKILPNGNFVISIPSLAPKELLIVDMIDIDLRSPKLLTVNCPDALSMAVQFMVVREYSRAIYILVAYLMLAGFIGSAFAVFSFLLP